MHDPTATDGPTTRRPAGVTAAIMVAAIGLILTLGTGTASADIVEPGDLGAEVGNRFCYNLQYDGAVGDVDYAVTGGMLPPGVFFLSHPSGAVAALSETRWGFSGEPTETGTFDVEITATDEGLTPAPGDDETDIHTFTINVGTEATADVVVHAGRLGLGYTIDCQSQGRETQGFLRDLDNFGTGGTVSERLAIRNHTPFDSVTDTGEPITAAQLATVDILLDGWVWDGTWTAAEIRDIGTWVNGGGVLIAAEDRNVADTLGRMFGAPTNPANRLCTHTPSEIGDPTDDCPELSATPPASSPIVDGPFGDWSADTLATSGSVGHFGATPPAGWSEIVSWATDPRDGDLPPQFVGNAAVITRPVGNGRVILLNDEALWRTQSFPGSANSTFVGNLMAYAIDEIGGGANPQPALADNSYTIESGANFSRNPCTNDPDDAGAGNASVFADTPLPPGVTFTPGTCALSGSATEDFSVAYQRTEGGVTAWAVITVAVTAPDLMPDLAPDTFVGVIGQAFDEGVCANDDSLGDAPRTTTISTGTLPPGLALNGCRVQGIPTTAGSFVARYRVTDDDGDSDTAQVIITITDEDTPTPTRRCKGQVATIVGTGQGETITGTPRRDVIVGLGGDDIIRGGGGNDVICGGGGDDRILGGGGDDRIFGQGGVDTVFGQAGNDLVTGQQGNDVLRGGGGTDRVLGNAGDDRLAGQAGPRDRCIGGPGVDRFLRGCEIERQ